MSNLENKKRQVDAIRQNLAALQNVADGRQGVIRIAIGVGRYNSRNDVAKELVNLRDPSTEFGLIVAKGILVEMQKRLNDVLEEYEVLLREEMKALRDNQ